MRLTALILLALLLTACGQGGGQDAQKGGRKPVFPVQVLEVQGGVVEYAITSTGSVEAFEQVLVTARVRGVIEKVNFREGQEVKTGDVLVEIEPQRYQNELEAAQARLDKADASHKDAQAGLKRREEANRQTPGIFSPDEVESWRNRVNSTKADVSQATADVKTAQLNLRDAYATAPMAGIIQSRSVQSGAYVQPGALIATLLRRDPLLLRFTVDEDEARSLKQGQQATFTVTDVDKPLKASLTHIAASASSRSRMVEVIAEVAAEDRECVRPGTFARIRIVTGSRDNAPAIPQTAVRPTERGFVAFVVENGQARMRLLTLGLRTEDGRVEVREGVKPGEKLVVRGAEALKDGVAVKIDEPVQPQDK